MVTSNSRDWGLTILRLWMGFLIAYDGFTKITGNNIGLATYISLQNFSVTAWMTLGSYLTFLFGGAAIFLGFAVRLAAFFTGIAAAYTVWKRIGFQISGLADSPHTATYFFVCVVFILAGPGRLNLGAIFR